MSTTYRHRVRGLKMCEAIRLFLLHVFLACGKGERGENCMLHFFLNVPHLSILCVLDRASSWYLNKGWPTRWHVLYYILLNMFQTLIRPSSGACEYLFCCVGWLEACWCYVAGMSVGDVVSECRPTLRYHITNRHSRYIIPARLKSAYTTQQVLASSWKWKY